MRRSIQNHPRHSRSQSLPGQAKITIPDGHSVTIEAVKDRRSVIVGSVGALALIGGAIAFEAGFQDRILPGVIVEGVPGAQPVEVSVGGLKIAEANRKLNTGIRAVSPRVNVRLGDQRFDVPASELGWRPDLFRTAQEAFEIGRRGSILTRVQDRLSALGGRVRVPLNTSADRNAVRTRLGAIVRPVTTPATDARMIVQGGRFVVVRDRDERGVDLEAAVNAYLSDPDQTALNFPVTTLPARVTARSLEGTVAQANALLRPLKLNYTEPTGTAHVVGLSSTEIAGFLDLEGTTLKIDRKAVQARLRRIGSGFDREARDARYVRVGAELKAQGDAPGWKLDLETAGQLLSDEILRPESNQVLLPILPTEPQLRADTLPRPEDLTLLAESYTSYAGSSRERVINVAVAAAKLDGYIVPAGKTFSFNQAVGPIEPEQGFAEGYVISGGRTIKGVGGGVCQASTTTFRALYKAGLPTLERNQHAYRVRWYDPIVGLDAAVYQPYLDLKMKNDTPGALIVRASTSGASMTVRVYGVSDGRKVNISSPVILSHTPAPAPKFEFDPSLRVGERKQVDWAADGYRVQVTRTVARVGQTTQTEVLASNYKAWQAVFSYGPSPRPKPVPTEARVAPRTSSPVMTPRGPSVTIIPALAPSSPQAPGRIAPPER